LPSASEPTPSSSSSSSEWEPVRVCKECSKVPWLCRCNPAQRAHLLSVWDFGEDAPEEVHAGQAAPVQVESRLFQRFSACHGACGRMHKRQSKKPVSNVPDHAHALQITMRERGVALSPVCKLEQQACSVLHSGHLWSSKAADTSMVQGWLLL
jgi:hypothetical protein